MHKTWTETEICLLKEKYNNLINDDLYQLFPNKTPLAIYKKAYSLGLRKTNEIESLNRSMARKGEKGSNWKGGSKKTKGGYICVLLPSHKRADRNGYVMEHIVVFEKETGIEVPLNCCIHHLNENKTDNRIENLCMMTRATHTRFHNLKRSR